MQKKQTILVVASLLVVVLSVTLAYFTAQIIGEGKNISVTSTDLKIIFTDTDGNIEGNDITPGWSNSKTFTVKNESNGTYKYDIIIKDLVNTFKTYKYLEYKITSTDGGYNMTDYSYLPKSSTKEDVALAYEVSIDKGKTHTYTIEIKYVNDESVDQSIDMGKNLSGTIYIREFTKPTMKLIDKLMADNPTIGTRTTFTAFTETNTGTLYKATEQIGTNESKDVYYFAGDAKNNWVKFGKTTERSCTYKGQEVIYVNMTNQTTKTPENETECTSTNICTVGEVGVYFVGLTESECSGIEGTKWITEKATWNGTSTKDIYWRIIRTNADGSIKLLYAGTSPDTDKAYVGSSAFNTTMDDPMYVGYKYGTTGSLENNRLNTNDSTIKTYVDNWYKNNLTAYTKYLSNDAVYCNDRNLASGENYSTTKSFDYASSERLGGDTIAPTYNCTNMSDAFSVNNASAKLDYPVGLMSIDELSYAGGEYNTDLTAPYAWYYTNANGESITGSTDFWALSSNGWGANSFGWFVRGSVDPGCLNGIDVDGSNAVRPSVSLSSCNLISRGNGSPENPYEIYTGSGVCE
jgi:hypothetical protein